MGRQGTEGRALEDPGNTVNKPNRNQLAPGTRHPVAAAPPPGCHPPTYAAGVQCSVRHISHPVGIQWLAGVLEQQAHCGLRQGAAGSGQAG
jgi:hypothetical protein